MKALDESRRQTINRNFALVVEFLDRKFRKTPLSLPEVPSYLYKGKKSKLEITVYSNPRVAKVDARIIGLQDYDREPAFECSYDLDGLSISVFQRSIDDLVSRID